ncbi:sigma-70 family RNA polymerase sigma factor [Sphaerisporangium sp. B11E5]|uniref:RNA polymerase sigma factor n=1 Tax=Sphaerisporangium sp. B11E5 TaxID=3153563 RepID=UPI00325E4956
MPDPDADSSLAERFGQGDHAAFADMYDRFAAPMFAAALNLLGDRELAADAVQQAFVQAWQAASSFDPSRSLRPWLYAIVRRTAIDVYRRERRFSGTVSLDHVAHESASGDEQSLERLWTVWCVREALERMSPDDRTVLYLAYFESLTQNEIAQRLGIPIGTVKSRVSRAQKRLLNTLGADFLTAGDSPSATRN